LPLDPLYLKVAGLHVRIRQLQATMRTPMCAATDAADDHDRTTDLAGPSAKWQISIRNGRRGF
jgi:hypothetical protein